MLKFSAKCDQVQTPSIETVEPNCTPPPVVIPTIPAHESKLPVDSFEAKHAMPAPEVGLLPVPDRNMETSAHKVLPEPQNNYASFSSIYKDSQYPRTAY